MDTTTTHEDGAAERADAAAAAAADAADAVADAAEKWAAMRRGVAVDVADGESTADMWELAAMAARIGAAAARMEVEAWEAAAAAAAEAMVPAWAAAARADAKVAAAADTAD